MILYCIGNKIIKQSLLVSPSCSYLLNYYYHLSRGPSKPEFPAWMAFKANSPIRPATESSHHRHPSQHHQSIIIVVIGISQFRFVSSTAILSLTKQSELRRPLGKSSCPGSMPCHPSFSAQVRSTVLNPLTRVRASTHPQK